MFGLADMKQSFIALIIGLIFGLGLVVSQMVNPAKILAFLDLTGEWDPSLAIVMGSALATAAVGYRFVFSRKSPLLSVRFQLPEKTDLDGKLIMGSTLFGIGWGLAGFCPGPAMAALYTGSTEIFTFFTAMMIGIFGFKAINLFVSHKQNSPIDG